MLVDNEPTAYNNELAKLAILLTPNITSGDGFEIDDCLFNNSGMPLKQIGYLDAECVDLENEGYETDVNDVVAFTIGTHDFTYKSLGETEEKQYKVVFVSIEGTSNLKQLWSNFDIDYNDNSYFEKVNPEGGKGTWEDHKDWISSESDPCGKEIKGFSVTKNRIIKKLEGEDGLFAKHNINLNDSNQNIILFVDGHSRGAAIANLLTAHYINKKTSLSGLKKIFSYCFATPNAAEDTEVNDPKYDVIQCIDNKVDIIPEVPFE